MFFKIVAPKKFAIFTGKHQCWGLFLIKLKPEDHATLLKRDFLWNTSGGCLWDIVYNFAKYGDYL